MKRQSGEPTSSVGIVVVIGRKHGTRPNERECRVPRRNRLGRQSVVDRDNGAALSIMACDDPSD